MAGQFIRSLEETNFINVSWSLFPLGGRKTKIRLRHEDQKGNPRSQDLHGNLTYFVLCDALMNRFVSKRDFELDAERSLTSPWAATKQKHCVKLAMNNVF